MSVGGIFAWTSQMAGGEGSGCDSARGDVIIVVLGKTLVVRCFTSRATRKKCRVAWVEDIVRAI